MTMTPLSALPAPAARLAVIIALRSHQPRDDAERRDCARLIEAIDQGQNVWDPSAPLHITGSALVLHPGGKHVLLHLHTKLGRWFQLGGHPEAGEVEPAAIALREAIEESGIPDLAFHPDPTSSTIFQVTIMPIPASKSMGVHEHADVRFVLSSRNVELPDERFRWCTLDGARSLRVDTVLFAAIDRVLSQVGRT